MWIVAKAILAARLGDYPTVPASLGDQRFGILGMTNQNHHAIIMRAPILMATQLFDELDVIAPVLLVTVGGGVSEPRVTRRMHAGFAA